MNVKSEKVHGTYLVSPRTLAFVFRDEDVLLIKRSPDSDLFPGQLNVPGGHLEPGETVLEGARRELREETGLKVDMSLRGIIHAPGVLLFLFAGRLPAGQRPEPRVGSLHWHRFARLPRQGVLPDLAELTRAIREAEARDGFVYGSSDGAFNLRLSGITLPD